MYTNEEASQVIKRKFSKSYTPVTESGCWLWIGPASRLGYGIINFKEKKLFAHRLSWEFNKGVVPNGLYVCHKCDTPSCINPDHLFLGTPKDNSIDKCNKKRHHNQKRTHCPKGHLLNDDYTVTKITPNGPRKIRRCKTCNNITSLAAYHKRKAKNLQFL